MTEFFAGVTGVLLIIAFLALCWLSQSSFTSAAMTPNIEALLNHRLSGVKAHIDHSLLSWDNKKRLISLHVEGLHLRDDNGASAGELAEIDIGTTLSDLLTGEYIPRALTAHHAVVRLIRSDDGRLFFGTAATQGAAPTPNDTFSVPDFKKKLQHIFTRLARAKITGKHQIDDIAIEVDDVHAQKLLALNMPAFSLEQTPAGLEGNARIDIVKNDKTASAEAHYAYDRSSKLHELALHLEAVDPASYAPVFLPADRVADGAIVDLPLTGDVRAALDNSLHLVTAGVDLDGDSGVVNFPAFWEQPRSVKNATLKADYKGSDQKLHGALAADFGGPKVDVTFAVTPALFKLRQMDVDFGVQLQDWPIDQYGQLWPRTVIPDAYDWMRKNIAKGNYDSGEAQFKATFTLDHPDDFDITAGEGSIAMSGGQVHYIDGMPPITDISATANFDLKQLSVTVKSGSVANIKLLPFTFKLTDLSADTAHIDLPLKLSGAIPDIMALLDAPPLGYLNDMGIKTTDIQGTAVAIIDLDFPLLQNFSTQDVDIHAKGTLADVSALRLIPGIELAKGNLAMTLDKNSVVLSGPLTVNNLPMQGSYQHWFKPEAGAPIREGNLTGKFVDEQWTTLDQGLFNGSHGTIGVAVQFSQPNPDLFTISGNADLSAADIVVDQVKWKKPAGVAGTFNIAADFPVKDGPVTVKSINLQSFNTRVQGSAAFSKVKDGLQLTKLDMPSLVLGRSNLSLHLRQAQDDQHSLIYKIEGPAADISGLKSSGNAPGRDAPAREFHLKVDRLYTGDTNFIVKAEGYARHDGIGWSEINVHGLAQGNHALEILLAPKDGLRTLKITSDDFGEMLQGLGITNAISGGALTVEGESAADQPRVITGKVKIGKFVVTNLPLLAVLINATSPFGFSDILSRSATFDRLIGHFTWDGDKVELIKLNAAGNSVGINAEGTINMASNKTDLHGTLVPFSIVNRAIGAIPVIGDVLTGGKGEGVLAVEYKVGGTLDNPNVSVNPISLLTPGFVRNIFFGGSDSDAAKADVIKTDTAAPQPTTGPIAPAPSTAPAIPQTQPPPLPTDTAKP